MKTVGKTLFQKENIAEVCYINIYISLQVFDNFLNIYMTTTVDTHDLIFGNIYVVFEIVNKLFLNFIIYLN